jgi:hypothetical protein
MTSDAPFTPPRKKHNILWWVAGFFALFVVLFFFQLFGPNPPIIVSPQTTYITKPLGPDGLPDYEQYILDLSREGVTTENNAAVLLWQAIWPGRLEPPQYETVARELGFTEIPSASNSLVDVFHASVEASVTAWLKGRAHANENLITQADEFSNIDPDGLHDPFEEIATKLLDQTPTRPWTSAQIPPLAQWVAENNKTLDLVVEASQRSCYYSPSPLLLNGRSDMLLKMELSDLDRARGAARSLAARAMWHLGEGRLDLAWRDLHAIHRLAHLARGVATLVDQVVALAISGIACDATFTFLDDNRLTADQVEQVRIDLNALPMFSSMSHVLDSFERLSYLDCIVHQSRDRAARRSLAEFSELGLLEAFSADWNVALRAGNELFDRLVSASRLPTYAARRQKFDLIFSEFQLRDVKKFGVVDTLLSQKSRSDDIAFIFVNLLLPAADAAIYAQDRSNTVQQLTRLAAALSLYRAEFGVYPQQLNELVPGVLDVLPVDSYHHEPFSYLRTEDGYLLYSVGENGRDDGGSHEQWEVLEGRRVKSLQSKFPAGADDISTRTPRPTFEFPALSPQSKPDNS